jgi:hypothetical protein
MKRLISAFALAILALDTLVPVASAGQEVTTAREIIELPNKITKDKCIKLAISVLSDQKPDAMVTQFNLNSASSVSAMGFYGSPEGPNIDIEFTCYSNFVVVNATSQTYDEETALFNVDFRNHLAADAFRVKLARLIKSTK